jgi:EAL and modified HD-GYP domain-containing signal transduction protein
MPHALIARQPIVDAEVRVQGYELLFRDQRHELPPGFDGDVATATVAINTLLDLGLRTVAGEHLVYVNMTRAFLTRELYTALPPERVVLEVLEDIRPEAEVLAAVRRARDLGYRIALDDYVHDEARAPLLELADVVKVEAPELDDAALAEHARLLRRPGLTLLAEKIETQERFELAREAGFELFQGWFYARPHLLQRRRLHSERASLLRLLAMLEDPATDFDEIGAFVEQNVSISYKLVRYVNSVLFSLAEPIESVRHACAMLGLERVRTCVTLLLLSEVDDKPHELMVNALSRARMCQLLAGGVAAGADQKHFTVGLFSLLDAFLDRPEEELLAEIPLAEDVRGAILAGEGDAGGALRAAVACERGDWEALESIGRDPAALQRAWLQAVSWSREVVRSLELPDASRT